MEKLTIDSFSTLFDYDTPKDCQNKRLTKSVTRSIDISSEICTLENVIFFNLNYFFNNFFL